MSRATDPVWLTGCGVVLSLGDDLAAFKEALFAARSAVPADTFDLPGTGAFKVPVARSMFDAASITAPSRLPLERGSAMALAAADAAFRMAGLGPGAFDAERTGLFWGSGMGGAASFEASCQALWGAQRRLRPTAVVTSMPNAALAEVALRLGIRGTAIGSACASAAVAIGEALRALQAGALDLAVVGGSEALLAPVVAGAWHAMRVLGPAQASAADRAGFALGEGEAAFVIETEAHARARRAGLAAGDIGHVNSHGTGTTAGDAAEAASLLRVFEGASPAVTATKSITGHLRGAGRRPRAGPGPGARRTARAGRLRHAMSNSFAFGGTNAVLIASRAPA